MTLGVWSPAHLASPLGALLVYRFGTFIPLPGIAPSVWEQIFRSAGWRHSRRWSTCFPAGPFIGWRFSRSGSCRTSPRRSCCSSCRSYRRGSERCETQGERGRRTIDLYTRSLTVLLSILQAYGIAIGLESVPGVVAEPGWLFHDHDRPHAHRWRDVPGLAQRSDHGARHRQWPGADPRLSGFVAEVPAAIAGALELGRQGVLLGRGSCWRCWHQRSCIDGIGRGSGAGAAAACRSSSAVRAACGRSTASRYLSFKLNNAGDHAGRSWHRGSCCCRAWRRSSSGVGPRHAICPAAAGPLFLDRSMRVADRRLRVLLHRVPDRSRRDRREPQEARRLPSPASSPGEPTAEYID